MFFMERKLLVILLALAMLFTFAPVAVFADTGDVSTADESAMLTEDEPGEVTEGGVDADPPHAEAGWDESHCHYYNEDGSLATGWIEEKHSFELASGEVVNWSDWYYADDKGEIQTGWLKYNKNGIIFSPKRERHTDVCVLIR